jgi:hypothetical protein
MVVDSRYDAITSKLDSLIDGVRYVLIDLGRVEIE